MSNVIDTIRARYSDAEARIERLRAEIEKAEAEKRDLHTTLRVLEGVGFGDHVTAEVIRHSTPMSRPAKEKKRLMLDLLGVGPQQGKAPAAVHKGLIDNGIDDINIGVVRTTLWRAADAGEISGGDGKYWKHEAEESFFNVSPAQSSSAG